MRCCGKSGQTIKGKFEIFWKFSIFENFCFSQNFCISEFLHFKTKKWDRWPDISASFDCGWFNCFGSRIDIGSRCLCFKWRGRKIKFRTSCYHSIFHSCCFINSIRWENTVGTTSHTTCSDLSLELYSSESEQVVCDLIRKKVVKWPLDLTYSDQVLSWPKSLRWLKPRV